MSIAGYVKQTRQLKKFRQLVVVPLGLASPEALETVKLPVTRCAVDGTLGKNTGQAVWRETILVAQLDWLWPRVCGKCELIP